MPVCAAGAAGIGHNIPHAELITKDAKACCAACASHTGCKFWTRATTTRSGGAVGRCFLKDSATAGRAAPGFEAGMLGSGPAPAPAPAPPNPGIPAGFVGIGVAPLACAPERTMQQWVLDGSGRIMSAANKSLCISAGADMSSSTHPSVLGSTGGSVLFTVPCVTDVLLPKQNFSLQPTQWPASPVCISNDGFCISNDEFVFNLMNSVGAAAGGGGGRVVRGSARLLRPWPDRADALQQMQPNRRKYQPTAGLSDDVECNDGDAAHRYQILYFKMRNLVFQMMIFVFKMIVASGLCLDAGKALPLRACSTPATAGMSFCNGKLTPTERATDLVARLTLVEKTGGVLSNYMSDTSTSDGSSIDHNLRQTAGVMRLGIPPMLYNEAMHVRMKSII